MFCVVHFEIPHKISLPYVERCLFYSQMKIEQLLDFRVRKRSVKRSQLSNLVPDCHQDSLRL